MQELRDYAHGPIPNLGLKQFPTHSSVTLFYTTRNSVDCKPETVAANQAFPQAHKAFLSDVAKGHSAVVELRIKLRVHHLSNKSSHNLASFKMFKKQESISTKATASMLSNNMAVILNASTGMADIAFVHKSVVHILLSNGNNYGADSGNAGDGYIYKQVLCKAPSANQQLSFVMVLQADWVEVAGRRLLVIATQKGVKMFEGDGTTLLHWHGFGSGDAETVFTRGICSVGGGTVCVGTSSGQLLVFRIPSHGGNITFEEYLSGHGYSVTAVVSRGDNLISADENGSIIFWMHYDGTSFKQNKKISGSGIPCNCLDVWKGMIVAGFADGSLKIYSIGNGDILAEVSAHARAVNAVHFSQGSGLLLTASEDSYVRVWKLGAGTPIELNHLYCDLIEDHQLVGAQFTDNEGKTFAVTAYDADEIFRYKRA